MRVTLFALSICSMCFLSGCGPALYRAEARVYVESAPEHASGLNFYASEVDTIKSLAKPLVPQGAELTVTHSIKDDIVTIAVTSTDPAQAADICNRIVEAYIEKTEEGVNKTVLEKANVPSRPI